MNSCRRCGDMIQYEDIICEHCKKNPEGKMGICKVCNNPVQSSDDFVRETPYFLPLKKLSKFFHKPCYTQTDSVKKD